MSKNLITLKGFVFAPFLIIAVTIVTLVIAFSTFSQEYRDSNQNMEISIEDTQDNDSVWKEYTNTTYSFSVKYPDNPFDPSGNTSYTERKDQGKFIFSAIGGCFQIHIAHQLYNEKELGGLLLDKKNVLDFMKINEEQTFDVYQNWKGMHDFTLKYTYKKLADNPVNGWRSFLFMNNYENHGEMRMYYITKDNTLYVVNSLSSGPCPRDLSEEMFETFSFIN